MRKMYKFLALAGLLLSSTLGNSQVFVQEDFNASTALPTGWSAVSFFGTSTNPCDGNSFRRNFWSSGPSGSISSPVQTATGFDIEVSFDYKIIEFSGGAATTGNFGVMNLEYSVDGGTSWTVYSVVDELSHTPSTTCATITNTIPAVDVPNGSNFRWRLNGSWTTGDYYFYVDNFSAIELVPCPTPIDVLATVIDVNSVTVGWTELGTATTWNIEYGAPGFTPGTGTELGSVVGAVSNPEILTGLTANTTYDVYVQADCGGGDLSTWGGPLNVTTLPSCPPVVSLTIDNLTTTDVTLSWTSQGVETQWNIEYGAPGFTPGTGTELGAITGTVNNPETISGLTPNTSYDIYVQADCGGDVSPWELVTIFTGYCTPVYTSTSDYLSKFETVGAVQNVLYTANAQPAGGYEDLTSTFVIQQFTNDQFDFETFFNGGSNTIRIWVDWNNDLTFDLTEEVANQYIASNAPNNAQSGTIVIPAVAPGQYTMRVRSRWGTTVPGPCDSQTWGSAIDVTLDVLPAPTCPRPTDLLVTAVTASTADITWTAGALETEWEVEYGEAGFVLGNGTSFFTNATSEQLTGLMDNTEYDVYVRAVCAPGDTSAWSTVATFRTLCLAFEAIDFCESFDSNSSTQACWTVKNGNGDADVWNLDYTFNTNTGDQVAALTTDFNAGNNDDWLITPQITLTGNEIMNFFYRVQSASEPNDFQVLLSTTGTDPLDFEDTLMFLASYNNTTYQDSTIDLSAFTGDVYIAFHVPAGGLDGWRLYIDDVCFDVCVPAAGQDGENDVCRADGLFDLNASVVKGQENGTWVFPSNQQLVVDDTLFNVTTLPAGSYEVLWIVEGGCTSDTTVSLVNVFPPSSAGVDGSIIACRNEPINLFDGLSGNLDLGGVWYNPSNAPLAGAITTTSNIPGSFNFLYITSNGVCAADTSLVEVIVGTCDFLSLGDEQFAELSVYPNPATDVLNIEASSNAGAMNIEISDINGRIVLADATALASNTSTTLSIAQLEKGVYTLRIFSNEGQRTFKIVKQ